MPRRCLLFISLNSCLTVVVPYINVAAAGTGDQQEQQQQEQQQPAAAVDAAKIENLATVQKASPAVGLRLMGILPCALQWQSSQTAAAPGKAPKMDYLGTARSSSSPYVLPTISSCCTNSANPPAPATSCCQDCRCCRQSYEHLPVPRMQQPPQVIAAMQQHQASQQAGHQHQHQHQLQHQQQHQHQLQHQQPPPQQQPAQSSCITTLQQTTTTQQMQPLSCLEAAATPAQQHATTSTTYLNNPPPATASHCHISCNRHNSNYNAFSLPNGCNDNNINPPTPAFANNSYNNAPPMIFVPFSVPVPHQQQQQQQPLQYAPQQLHSLPAVKNSMPPLGQTPAPPPPQPPPLVLPLAFHCPYPPPVPALSSLPQPPISGPLPPRAPPTPPPRIVLPLKAVAAAAIRAHQKNGKLPRNLPALRAMEMALRTNSFATTGGVIQPMEEADNSDSEMEYMIPLHSE
ncbi:uncharacterized protein LOC135437089 [Drosophila montana]|uniref:uncharacterized protein LOC135437089 n=1 Tax=Drosophila montana TaxID=40370 RepID=UPI00313AD625